MSLDTLVLLVRHAHTGAIGRRLTGRAHGVALSDEGCAQAARLARALAATPIAAIYTSPLERAVDTAHAIARHQTARVHVLGALNEVDFGRWTGKTFAELEELPEWRRFNDARSIAPVPDGERAHDVQQRIVAVLDHLRHVHPGETVAAVSHAEVIRAAVLHCMHASLDLFHQIEIAPASVTALSIDGSGPRLLFVNHGLDATVSAMPHL